MWSRIGRGIWRCLINGRKRTIRMAQCTRVLLLKLVRRFTDRLIVRTKERWEVIKFFRFSSRLALLIEKYTALASHFDRAIGCKAANARETQLTFAPQHVPQLLWKDEFDTRFKTFFPCVQECSARRFCAMALVKLCDGHTWGQAALELELPVKAGIKMANQCITILGATRLKEEFGRALQDTAVSLSSKQSRVDYRRRRKMFSTFSDIPTEIWEDICRSAGINTGQPGRRSRYAAIWLWAELTGGDWRLALGLAGENTNSARTVYNKLNATLMPRLASHLSTYGSSLLPTSEPFS